MATGPAAWLLTFQTSGWDSSLNIIDLGAFINANRDHERRPPALPVVSITTPVDQAVYTWVAGSGPLSIRLQLGGFDSRWFKALLTLTGSVNGTDLGATPIGLGTANATASG